MNTNLSKTLFIATAIFSVNNIYGQFSTAGGPNSRWAETNDPLFTFNDIRRGGMGNFTNFGTAPGAAFHINENYLTDLIPTAINYYLPGEVFRTTGPSTNVNAWRMFTGANNGTERFSLTIPANSDDVVLQATQNGAKMIFGINGSGLIGGSIPISRMVITDGAFFGNTGLIGMGNGFLNPQSQLHLNDGLFATYLQITNLATNASALNPATTDGFKLGIAADGTAEIRQQEDLAMKFFTNDMERMHINESRILGISNSINGFQVNTSGFVGIGPNTNNFWNTTGPFTLLHLNGEAAPGDFAQEWGYRPWMRTGISFTDQIDYSYVGYRSVDPSTNLNEFNISWGNDLNSTGASNIHGGLDDMVFRFIAAIGPDIVPNPPTEEKGSSDFTRNDDMDGRHIARFTPIGFFGLGPNFGHTFDNPLYVRPQSMFHMSTYQQDTAWIQVTNQTGTQQTATDGLRIGITGTGTAHIKQQENLPLIFYTNNIENARVLPSAATTLGTNVGMLGIGDWTTAYNILPTNVIDAKLDVDGDLRIRTVTERDSLTRVLVIDSTDHNRVHWRSISSLEGLGNYCSQPQNPLTDNYEIPLNNFNYYFTDPVGTLNHGDNFVKIGDDCTTPINAKLEVHRGVTTNTQFNNIGALVLNEDNANNTNNIGFGFGIIGNATGPNENNAGIRGTSSNAGTNYGGFFDVAAPYVSGAPNKTNIAVEGRSRYGYNTVGGRFTAVGLSTSLYSYGVESTAYGSDMRNVAGAYMSSHSSTSSTNFGIAAIASNGFRNIGVWASADTSNPANRAGYFVGKLESTVPGVVSSDQKFKTNVEGIKGATDILKKLKPHTYKMDVSHYPQFNFEGRLQYGFIAQEVGEVLPDLVHDSYMPSELDSLGNEISPAVDYKSLNYNALIPITVQAVNELTEKLEKSTLSDQSVKTNVNTLNGSLAKVKQMRGVSYVWTSTAQNDMNLDSLEHIGFIAQEVAAIEPLLTFVDDSSLVHVNYDRVAPLLVESVKELDDKISAKDSIINSLQNEIDEIKNCLRDANICYGENNRIINQNNEGVNNKRVILVNNNSIILDQNLPNPFAENTVINYNIPQEVGEAKLLFYDLNGRIIKELIIEERGESKLTVYGTNLKTGVYTYSLIADGQLIATKKMVKK